MLIHSTLQPREDPTMTNREKLAVAKSRVRSGVQDFGDKSRRAGNAVWNGLKSKRGRKIISAAVVAGIKKLPLPPHPVSTVASVVVMAGVQAWADPSE